MNPIRFPAEGARLLAMLFASATTLGSGCPPRAGATYDFVLSDLTIDPGDDSPAAYPFTGLADYAAMAVIEPLSVSGRSEGGLRPCKRASQAAWTNSRTFLS